MASERLYSLQVLRAVAASGVVLLHATNLAPPAQQHRFDLGATGVDLFFVISGVIMALIAKGSPVEFLKRRIWRVVPLYFILSALIYPLSGRGPRNALTTITFWPAWPNMVCPVLGVGWTLCFEMLFYLCVALMLTARIAGPLLLIAYAVCVICLYAVGAPVFQFLGNPIIAEFLMGFCVALWWKRGGRLPHPWLFVAAGVGLMCVAPDIQWLTDADATFRGASSALRVVWIGIPAALIVAAFLSIEHGWPKFLVAAGDASYSIYLGHAAAITPFSFVILPPWLQPFSVIFFLGLSATAAFFTYQWIEKPLLARARRSAHDRSSRLASPLEGAALSS